MNYRAPEDNGLYAIAYSDEHNKPIKTLNKLFKAMKLAILNIFQRKQGLSTS